MTRDEQFQVFWSAYPRRVAKGNARKAFAKAIGKTDLQTMLMAIDAYISGKPAWMDFKHPATWLNSEGWDDEWATEPARTTLSAAQSIIQRLERESERERQDQGHEGHLHHAQLLPSTEWH